MATKTKKSSSSSTKSSSASKSTAQNGKGSAPRNNTSKTFRSNFDGINWGK